MILETVVVKCPHCNRYSSHHLAVSGTILDSIVYTDGKMVVLSGMYSDNPFIVKCKGCKRFFFFEDHYFDYRQQPLDFEQISKSLPDLCFDEFHLQVEDYYEALNYFKGKIALEREIVLRTRFWWAVNDIIRNDADWSRKQGMWLKLLNSVLRPLVAMKRFHPQYANYKRWLMEKNENLIELLSLLKLERFPEEWLTAVEIYRELSQFNKAAEALINAPAVNNQKYLKLQKKLISKRDLYVRRIQ